MSNSDYPRNGGQDLREEAYNPRSHLSPLHDAAMRLAEYGLHKPRSKTRELMTLLLCHGARAWRYSQPEARIHLHICTYGNRKPVRLRLR
ncbi:hypothetical protein ACQ3G6_10195 [Allorhizobium undicola]|uniref:hypothetical protein n=1 Tax=Allorhizobium undicola TaxID=78527 RepID=UPI00047FC12D|nr:hypothetical protein [Allorhizobium undicola]